MRFWLLTLLTFNFSLIISNCGLDVEDPTPPSPPVWVQKSLPEDWPERGIDAHETGGIFMEWTPSHQDDIKAYFIFKAEYFEEIDSMGDYELSERIDTESLGNLTYLNSNASVRKNYSFKLKALGYSENQSEFSDSIRYSLLPAISATGMVPNGINDTLNIVRGLSWSYDHHIEMEDYHITIVTQSNDFIWRDVLKPSNYINGAETTHIPAKVVLESGQIYKWRIDTAGKYVNGVESCGSESPWATFLYILIE